ncbi:PhzF family phenazine biosynthesis protein [Flavihumibacter fluvii]|uniref:PhzF family phenazine biosynthesis protein n=1 Tax=Flavihumibacter fluvii TaxID=2838157 RepID=UPI001BDED476|nr:PhzF family phenazine biosynthesis protein [Flavihumibacter fluvii]ULQ53133.1 PhzF family phenazine biosynthesis protein [Flavihumibacter fluvii]
MQVPIYIIDAFTEKQFGGNPAAVLILDQWLPDRLMQQIAMENNQSETTFLVKENDHYRIRWFTPTIEVKLCGHATLAASHVLFCHKAHHSDTIQYQSLSGELLVTRHGQDLTLDFPANPPQATKAPELLFTALGIKGGLVFTTSFDYMVLLENQQAVEALEPDFSLLATIPARGVICTAKGDHADFVSRCFYPQSGINEDPVTGSAHTIMVPFWADQLNKSSLDALQLSKRKGYLRCTLQGNRVLMTGTAVTYLEGKINC